MFAILKSGGKQYTARQGDVLRLEKIEGEEGQSIMLSDILAVGSGDEMTVGTPFIMGAGVQVRILETKKDKKVLIFKKKRRTTYRTLKGHRQWVSVVRVESLIAKDADKVVLEKPVSTDVSTNDGADESAVAAKKTAAAPVEKVAKEKVAKAPVEKKAPAKPAVAKKAPIDKTSA